MAASKVVFATLASVGLVAAAVVGGIALAPRAGDAAALESSSASLPFTGVAPLSFDDPAGDASDVAWGDAGTWADCLAGALLQGKCLGAVPAVSSPSAAEHLDIVGVGLAEPTADEVVVTLELARLDEGLAQLDSPEGMHRMVTYGACLYTEGGCTRAVYLDAMRHGDAAHMLARFDVYAEDCNEWSWCAWPLPVDVQYGAPATVTFTVPKAWFAFDGGLDVHHLDAWTAWSDQPTAFPMWHGGFTVHTPARHVHDHTFTPAAFGVGDMTPELAAGITLSTPADEPATPAEMPLASGHGGVTHARGSAYDRPEMDLVGFDMHDDEDGLALVIALREAHALPEGDFDYSVALGFEGAPVMEVGYRVEKGEPVGYAGVCIMEECQESRTHEVEVDFVPGAPAFLVVHLPAQLLDELAGVGPGARTTLVWVSAMVTDGSQYFGEHDAAVYGDVHHAFMADEIVGVAPFVLGSGHRAPLDAFASPEGAHGHAR